MIVTNLVPVTKNKYKIFLEGEFAFVLYKGELSRFRITQECELSTEEYEELKKIVSKRAKLRAMHLLNAMSRTEEQLKVKLRQGHYTEDVIEQALSYVKSFGYVNDEAYARQFAECKKGVKSKKEMSALLIGKGLDKKIIEQTLGDVYGEEDAKQAIQKLIAKKKFDPKTAEEKEKSKMYGYLTRKGFSYEDIRQVIQVSSWDA